MAADSSCAAALRPVIQLALLLALGCEVSGPHRSSGPHGERPAATLSVRRGMPAAEPLRLATWNLMWLSTAEQGRVRRSRSDLERLRDYAKRLNADVVALQEVAGEQALDGVFSPTDYEFALSQDGGAQRVAFAWRRALGLTVETTEVELGGPRPGLALQLRVGSSRPLTLLNVHLKSGCFEPGLPRTVDSCATLVRQLELVESWAESQAVQHRRFAVLGDFNRRLFAEAGDPLWTQLNDGEPASLSLWSPTDSRHPQCWGARYPDFIDHLLFDREALLGVVQGSFSEMTFDVTDRPYMDKLSDHCPLAVLWRP